MPGELSVLVASACLRPSDSVMNSTRLGPTIDGLSVSQDTVQQCHFLQVTFISTEHSTELHDQCLVQFFRKRTADLSHPPISRSRHRGKPVQRPCWRVSTQTDWIFQPRFSCASECPKFAAASSVPYVLVSNSPHQLALSRSGGNSQTLAFWMANSSGSLLMSINMSLHDLACWISVIIKLIKGRTASDVR